MSVVLMKGVNTERLIKIAATKHSRRYLDKNNPMRSVSSYNDCFNSYREVLAELEKELKIYLAKNPDAKLSDIL